jgi:hypothetical protein
MRGAILFVNDLPSIMKLYINFYHSTILLLQLAVLFVEIKEQRNSDSMRLKDSH